MRETKRPLERHKGHEGDKKAIRETKRPLGRHKGHWET